MLVDLARELRANPATQLDLFTDLFGIDYPDRDERFDVVYNLYSIPLHQRLFLKVPVREDDAVVPSLIDVWKGVDWFERELFDMFGIRVEGHPNLPAHPLPRGGSRGTPCGRTTTRRGAGS